MEKSDCQGYGENSGNGNDVKVQLSSRCRVHVHMSVCKVSFLNERTGMSDDS